MLTIIDVSNHQGDVDFVKVKRSGVTGVWLKATEGLTFDDKTYLKNRDEARAAGLRVGAYHFARPDRQPYDPQGEARHFSEVSGKPGRRDLKPVLDFEVQSKDLSRAQHVAWARSFNVEYKKRRGIIPMFYSYQYLVQWLGPTTPIGNGLWLANYGANDGKPFSVQAPYPWKKVTAHQYTSNGTVPGVAGECDVSTAPRLPGVLAYGWRGVI